MNKSKIVVWVLLFFSLMILSETLYLVRNKQVFYTYVLNSAKTLNKSGKTDAAFFLATLTRYKLPTNMEYRKDVENDFNLLPEKLGLSVLLYYFALSAYQDGLPNMLPELLNISIKLDPDFSFWRVELANYYLVIGDRSLAQRTLEDCFKFEAPRKHCEDYMHNSLLTNQPQNVGFLKDSVVLIYKLYPNL